MSTELSTIARPYAKAIFEFSHDRDELELWSSLLQLMAQISLNDKAIELFTNPSFSTEEHADFMMSIGGERFNENAKNLIKLLARNKRILLLPDIKALYEVFRADAEKHIDVDVISFSALTDSQEDGLIKALGKKLNRKVTLHVAVDKTLLGGVIIRAGDMVIDGSVRGKLTKLSTEIAA
jgi:F-type H+-transporting ATPase subunit delta